MQVNLTSRDRALQITDQRIDLYMCYSIQDSKCPLLSVRKLRTGKNQVVVHALGKYLYFSRNLASVDTKVSEIRLAQSFPCISKHENKLIVVIKHHSKL